MMIKAGSALMVPRAAGKGAEVSEHVADNGRSPSPRNRHPCAGHRSPASPSAGKAADVADWNGRQRRTIAPHRAWCTHWCQTRWQGPRSRPPPAGKGGTFETQTGSTASSVCGSPCCFDRPGPSPALRLPLHGDASWRAQHRPHHQQATPRAATGQVPAA